MTQTPAWSHLPNAKHIDRVLASLNANPWKWGAVKDLSRSALLSSSADLAWSMGRAPVSDVVWGAAWSTALALATYDDCAYMLDSDVNELRIIAALGDPRAILLLPACIVFNKIAIT